jgi:transcriptional regulator with XRE-family HTH domain
MHLKWYYNTTSIQLRCTMKVNQKSAMPGVLAELLSDAGKELARRRIARRMTQALAAERARISRNTVSRIENGDPSVAVGQVVRYLDALEHADVFLRALAAENDPAVRMLEIREKTRRARALTAKELERYDF